MNILLKKFLTYLSILAFSITFFVSFHAGTPLMYCFLRGCVALVFIGFVGCFAIKGVFRDIALELAEYEKKRKEEEKKAKYKSYKKTVHVEHHDIKEPEHHEHENDTEKAITEEENDAAHTAN